MKKKASKTKRAARSCAPLTGSAHVDALYAAVIKYVEAGGGKLVVIGGVQVQEWPQDNAGVFMVAVKCMGRKPTFVAPNAKLCDDESQK